MFRIVKKEKLNPVVYRMEVEAPRVAESALPGQFLIVIPEEHGERIPLTISDYDRGKGTVTIVTQRIGVSTGEICALEEGQCFCDVTGPLGQPSGRLFHCLAALRTASPSRPFWKVPLSRRP